MIQMQLNRQGLRSYLVSVLSLTALITSAIMFSGCSTCCLSNEREGVACRY